MVSKRKVSNVERRQNAHEFMAKVDHIIETVDKMDKTLHGNGREGLVVGHAVLNRRFNILSGAIIGSVAILLAAAAEAAFDLLPFF